MKIGYRKLIFALVLTTLATVICWFKETSFNEWSNFMIWIYGTYASTNVGEYFGKAITKRRKR